MSSDSPQRPREAADVLAALREGNYRFSHDLPLQAPRPARIAREELGKTQAPFAIVLSCSDARVPSEMVFDCGLGDLFVVRLAGNVVAPSVVGSVEFAAASFDTRLVVVMGHTRCGAISATLGFLRNRAQVLSQNVQDIVDRICPSVAELVDLGLDDDKLAHAAIRANVRASVGHLQHGSAVLERLRYGGKLSIVAAEYDLDTGVVDFFDTHDVGGPIR